MNLTNHQKGILYMLLSSMLFAFMGLAVKKLSLNINSVEIVFFRSLFGVIFVMASFYYIPNTKKGGKAWILFFRGLVGFIALLMFFYNITHLSLAKAVVFSQTSTIFTTIFAFLIFKEQLNIKAWIGIFVGFIGIVFITEPSLSLNKSDYLGVLSGVLAGMAYNSVKQLRHFYDSRVIVLSFALMGTICPIILMSFYYFIDNEFILNSLDFIIAPFIVPKPIDWLYIVLLGIFATSAQILLTKAYGYTKAGIVATIGYSTIVFSIIVGLFLGEGFPNLTISMGILFVIISGILVTK